MYNPLKDVPLNTKRVYVLGITKDGCQVFMPVNSNLDSFQKFKQKELQDFLDSLPEKPEPPLAPIPNFA